MADTRTIFAPTTQVKYNNNNAWNVNDDLFLNRMKDLQWIFGEIFWSYV